VQALGKVVSGAVVARSGQAPVWRHPAADGAAVLGDCALRQPVREILAGGDPWAAVRAPGAALPEVP
jgi:hypothetical protein